MAELQSRKPVIQAPMVEEAGVQFDPRGGGISAWYRGNSFIVAIILIGFFALAFTAIIAWKTLGIFAPSLLIASFGVCAFLAWLYIKGDQAPAPKVFSSTKTVSFEGLSENILLQSGLLQALAQRVHAGHLQLPEPDAKADPKSGKPIPFGAGEKDKIIEQQKTLEATVIEEITGTASGSN